jgi:hypothetical protein
MEKKFFPQRDQEAYNTAFSKQRLRAWLPTLVINAVLPFLIYQVMTGMLHQPEFLSLIATGIPSLVASIVGIIRTRRINTLAGIVLLGIVAGLILTLLSHDARLLLIRESFFTATFGIAFLVSLLFPKPLTYYIGRSLAAEGDPERQARYETRWRQQPGFRRVMRGQTVILGIGLLVEAVVRSSLLFLLPVALFLAISPLVQWGTIGVIVVGLVMFRRHSQR